MTSGLFISIEGIEGAGKSTAIKFIYDYLTQAGKDVVLTREPGGTALAEQIRHVLLHPDSAEPMSAEAELLLMFAARAQHIQQLIQPALRAGKWVVSDRFVDASYAYQGGGRGVAEAHIAYLDHWIVGHHAPELTLLFDIPAAAGLARARGRGGKADRIESEQQDFFAQVRERYLARAKADPKRIHIIDAGQPLLQVHAQLRSVLDKTFKETGRL